MPRPRPADGDTVQCAVDGVWCRLCSAWWWCQSSGWMLLASSIVSLSLFVFVNLPRFVFFAMLYEFRCYLFA